MHFQVKIFLLLFFVSHAQLTAAESNIVTFAADSGIEFYLEVEKSEIVSGEHCKYTFGIYNGSNSLIEWIYGEDRPYDLYLNDRNTGETIWQSSSGRWFSTETRTAIFEIGENWELSKKENF